MEKKNDCKKIFKYIILFFAVLCEDSKGISAGIVVAITVPTVVVVFMLVALGFVLCLKRPSLQIIEHEC